MIYESTSIYINLIVKCIESLVLRSHNKFRFLSPVKTKSPAGLMEVNVSRTDCMIFVKKSHQVKKDADQGIEITLRDFGTNPIENTGCTMVILDDKRLQPMLKF